MLLRVLRYVRLPLVLIVIWTVLRFINGPVFGTPYAPRGNAMFSILGLFSQVLIFLATLISYAADLDTYFRHWDALNIPEGTTATMSQALITRASGLLFGPIMVMVMALIGRAVFGALSPRCDDADARLP